MKDFMEFVESVGTERSEQHFIDLVSKTVDTAGDKVQDERAMAALIARAVALELLFEYHVWANR